ncbi:MAG: hypothetical protein OIF40_12005 [Mangrovicoccus sp.]|nr:hypothetical protein [Mangrovicoccus sp.]
MIRNLLAATLCAGTALFGGAALAEEPAKLVTVVTSPEPQTQLMAMVLTMQAAKAGAEAHVLLCGPAGDLALKEAPESATAGQPPKDMSPQGLMQKLREATGAKVEVCAIYLPGKAADASVLLDGITVAKPPAMAARLMEPGTRVMNF